MCASFTKGQYCFKNKQYSKDEYNKIIEKKLNESQENLLNEFLEFAGTVVKKMQNLINCENCSGDYLQNCKNSIECFDCFDLEDCKYVIESVGAKDSMDMSMHDKDIELCYEVCSGGESNKWVRFSYCPTAGFDSDYLHSCFYLTESFACNGFHSKNKHCILNKKYSEDDYQAMRKKIIEHMIKTGEYGEYFPIELSLFSYNETIANEYFPMSKEEVIAKGWKWKDKNPKWYMKSDYKIPARIEEVEGDVVNKVLACEECGKNYKIQLKELGLCRKLKVNLSNKCPECRHMNLLSLKNPRNLWDRKCDKCGIDLQTTYSSERSEKVYCEKCYLKEVY